ncbi:hypothetical protein FIBSPDRAFT_880748 [Athelia psychrophila]|uniref:Uncharacterized protein n=1 Tax=Athelia psychrophila TaxID=1759441 RepID=A0A166WW57_9AGAM|nr:hypothetical protein FIBSPDRAFT_880748 [Fibularhizoctonia sp. CBS 109695]
MTELCTVAYASYALLRIEPCTAKYHYLALHTDKMTVRVSAGLECPTATQKRRVSNWLDAALFHGEMVARSFVDHCHGVRMQTYADSMHLGSRCIIAPSGNSIALILKLPEVGIPGQPRNPRATTTQWTSKVPGNIGAILHPQTARCLTFIKIMLVPLPKEYPSRFTNLRIGGHPPWTSIPISEVTPPTMAGGQITDHRTLMVSHWCSGNQAARADEHMNASLRRKISKNLSQNTNHTKLGHQPPGHWAVYLANHKAFLSSTSSLGRHCICHCELSVISNCRPSKGYLGLLLPEGGGRGEGVYISAKGKRKVSQVSGFYCGSLRLPAAPRLCDVTASTCLCRAHIHHEDAYVSCLPRTILMWCYPHDMHDLHPPVGPKPYCAASLLACSLRVYRSYRGLFSVNRRKGQWAARSGAVVLALCIFWATWSLGLSGHDIECADCIIRASRDDFVALLISQSDEGTSEMRLITRLIAQNKPPILPDGPAVQKVLAKVTVTLKARKKK